MNKKLIALALAAVPALSLADVTIYGRIVGGLESDSIKTVGGTSTRQTNVQDYLSWIGFKGQEDLGNGLKAIWQVENHIVIDGTSIPGTNTFATRDSFVGLAGDFGKLRLGKLPNAQRDMFDVDPWNNANGANALDIFKRTAYRPNNAIRYDSPNFAGFNASLLWGAGENRSSGVKSSNAVNLGLHYRHGSGFFAQYGYDKRSNSGGTTANKKADIHSLEAGYIANNLHVALGLQRTRGYDWDDRAYFNETTGAASGALAGLKTREVALTLGYSFGPFKPKLSLAKGWDQKTDAGSVTNSGYRQYILGVDYALSKRTAATLAHGRLSLDNNAGYGGAGAAAVKRQSTTSLSLQHWF